jgi:soluble lytic murein transglycosylase
VNLLTLYPACRLVAQHAGFGRLTPGRRFLAAVLVALWPVVPGALAQEDVLAVQRAAFTAAWEGASQGDRELLERSLDSLAGYILHPYLRYEDLRHRRRSADEAEMSGFLEAHRDWAFAPGLETAWLRSLGERGQWNAVLKHGGKSQDTEVRCHFANARIQTGATDGLLPVARALWTKGESQPDACDPVFAWLKQQGGINSGLAWERFGLAMEARERKLARYIVRFMDEDDRAWAERWLQQDRKGYRQLDAASRWPDSEKGRTIVQSGLGRLARDDPDRAWEIFLALDGAIGWSETERGAVLADLALWSAVGRSPHTDDRMQAVPAAFRDGKLLEWWVRQQLLQKDWAGVIESIAAMPPELQDDSRWLYWIARARTESGAVAEGRAGMEKLALRANYYGFLAADHLGLPYAICPEAPNVPESDIGRFLKREGVDRALELRLVGLPDWARSEWGRAVRGLDTTGLRAAAAVAVRADWPDMAIFALGNSGDSRWYEWRFPLAYEELSRAEAVEHGLDSSWVLGLMRSESALAEDAISHAGARGLMQITPGTATRIARRHSFPYGGRAELLDAATNIRFGTAFLGDLLERFFGNPVLATGAYNAGPKAVERWIADEVTDDPAIWIDTLPFFETRDYIPRVLAFSTIYEWRLGQAVKRISSRMPPLTKGGAAAAVISMGNAKISCTALP